MSTTSRRRVAGILSSVVAVLLVASLGVLVTSTPSHADPGDAPGTVTSVPLEVTTSPAVAARRAAGFTAYPVPTSDAGLGNIVTAPDGVMWFVMEKKNKLGAITPQGQFTEIQLPATTTGAHEGLYDLTVAPDGTLWAVYDFGRYVIHVDPRDLSSASASAISHPDWGTYPYAERIAMGPDGVPWVTASYNEDGLVRVLPTGAVWHRNAPPCDGALAPGRDGGMWCSAGLNKLVLSNADASGGTTYPLPSRATDIRSLAAGPVGSVWFSRYASTMFTSPSRGDIGWIDRSTGRTTVFDTGSRTGPKDLVLGPDGKMWFTNRGVGKGIGHLDAKGRGALSKVGDYEPDHLTFDHHGFVWFTDSANNSIVRVDPAQLRVTNVEVGDGSVFTPKPGAHPPGAPKAPVKKVGKVRAGKKPVRTKRNKVRVPVVCPKKKGKCKGIAVLRHHKKARAFSKARPYAVKAGKRKVVVLKLTKPGRKAVKRKPRKVRATLITRSGDAVRDHRIRVRR